MIFLWLKRLCPYLLFVGILFASLSESAFCFDQRNSVAGLQREREEAPKMEEQEKLPPSSLYSKACVLIDGYSGRTLYGKEETAPRANASTTKIMTCILALENGNTEDTVTASKRAVRQPKVRLGMKQGGKYILKDLLYCLMLESFNDCAVAIAEHIAGSVEEFARLMNDKARQIGCLDTYFITPNGLDDEKDGKIHHTTAEDLGRIMRYCAWESPKSADFLKITRESSYQFKDGQGSSHSLNNHNRLLTTMDGALTGKTGFTADAGYCYVMAYEKNGKRFCAAFLGCGWPNNKNYKWMDARTLMDYADATYEKKELWQEPVLAGMEMPDSCPPNPSLMEWNENVLISPKLKDQPTESLTYMLRETDKTGSNVIYVKVQPPVEKEELIGYYEITLNGVPVGQYAIVSDAPAYPRTFGGLFAAVINDFLL